MSLYVNSGYVDVGYTIDDVTIDWGTKVIYVPKDYTTLVQSTPIEIRQLSINEFRLKLKELEWSVDGIPNLRTHNHNTEVLLGGIVYARVIEMINGYTITFEDGAYAVNLIGANSNIGDVINLNRVSVRSANAAGLISNQAIEYASFNGGITVDYINGTTGTVFPRGTPQLPVNNIPDAIIISQFRGFNKIYIKGDYTFDTGDILAGYIIIGESAEKSYLTFNSDSIITNVNIFDATVNGVFDSAANFTNCHIINTQFVQGTIKNCILEGEITLSGNSTTTLINCSDGLVIDGGAPSVNFNGSGNSLAIRNYEGDINLTNKTGPENVEINMSSGGHVTIDSSVTAGNIRITGIADVTDNTTSTGVTINISRVIFPNQLQLSSFNGYCYLKSSDGQAGTKYPLGTLQQPVNNITDALAICDERGFETIILGGPLYLTDTDISGKIIIGENNLDSVVVLISGNTTTKTTFKNTIISGEINGHIFAESCALQTLRNLGSEVFPTIFRDCIIRADVGATPAITLYSGGTENIHFINCSSGVPGQDTASLDVNHSLSPLAFRKYGGGIKILNIIGNQDCTFEFDQGQIKIDSTCTNGTIRLGGIYKLINEGSLTIEERNQSITDSINLSGASFSADTELIAAAVWDKLTADHETANTFGKMLNDILFATGQAQHSLNVNTELLQNKPNNP